MNTGGRRLLIALALITLLTAGGTVGYMLIERMPFEDALFMTIITITTVGYGEVKPLDAVGSVFTIVVIENDPEKERLLMQIDEPYMLGSALEESILDQAGIAAASEIVIATASDPDNVFIALSARSKNPQIRIRARAESEIGLKHLELAGVDQAISSYHWSAMRIANAIARPAVVDFLDLLLPGLRPEEFGLEEVRVPEHSNITGRTIASLEHEGDRIRIVALKRGADPMTFVPEPHTEVLPGDLFVAIGARPSLRRLAERLGQ